MILRCLALLFVFPVFGAELRGKKFEDSVTVGGKKLELNALGIRRVTRFGLPIKVYVGGFYVAKKANDPQAMLSAPRPIVFRQVFLLSTDRGPVVDGWTEAFNDNCETDCEKAKAGLKEFNNLLTDVHDGTELTMTITKDGVEVDNKGTPPKKGMIKNPAFANAFMAIFFGKNPPDLKFQKELINQAKE